MATPRWTKLIDHTAKMVFWKPTAKGEAIVGELMSIGVGQMGNYLTLQLVDGSFLGINLSAVLERVVWENLIGRLFRFTYQGDVTSKNRGEDGEFLTYKLYDVELSN